TKNRRKSGGCDAKNKKQTQICRVRRKRRNADANPPGATQKMKCRRKSAGCDAKNKKQTQICRVRRKRRNADANPPPRDAKNEMQTQIRRLRRKKQKTDANPPATTQISKKRTCQLAGSYNILFISDS
ncbi:hypothetical protein, partial [Bacillus timonensis]|uniref:hypothetical protein n=1 Tax=Bacillus timonensis TaxID=1033734 RepID=UPI000287A344